MFQRRRPLHEWPRKLLRRQVVAGHTSDPRSVDVRAALVLHQDPELLPERATELAAAEAERAGEPFYGIAPYLLYTFGFTEEDRDEVFRGGSLSCLVKDYCGYATQEEAEEDAREWVGAGGLRLPFDNLPGIYQAAFFELVTGEEEEPTPATFMWALPSEGSIVPVREFPVV